MGVPRAPVFKIICRSCLSRAYQYRGVASVGGTPTRAVPLRIFATENLSDDVYANFGVGRSELAREEKEKRYQEWLEKRVAQAPPNERLSRELKSRVGKSRPRGLKRAVDSFYSPAETAMITRTRTRRDASLTPLTQIDPAELIQAPKAADTEDAIYDAIESCIGTAIDRLELYPQQQNNRDHATDRITIPHDQYMWLSSILKFQFSKQQLVGYGTKAGLKKSHAQKCKTSDAIALILDKIWNLEKEPELPPDEALVTKSMHRL
jgi:hypothetical protein